MFSYEILKCKGFTFVKSLPKNLDNYIIVDDEHPIDQVQNQFEQIQNQFEQIQSDQNNCMVFINTTSKEFDDIKILSSGEHENERSDKIVNDIQKPMMGSSDNLEAIKTNQYSILHGKKNANINSVNLNQNHEVIDSIAINGVMMGPKTELNSIKKLFNILSKFESFELLLYNPYLIVEELSSTNPTVFSVPVVITGKGDICKIFYRYICLYFFGYMSIKEMLDPEFKYDI